MSRESEAESIRLLNAKKKPEKVYDPDDEYGDGGPQLTYAISPRHSPRIDSTEEESPVICLIHSRCNSGEMS